MANISFYGSHNAAVAVEENGELITVIEVERFLSEKLNDLGLTSDAYIQTLVEEIQEYQQRNMINLCKFLIYLMDTCQQNDIVTGIGRGSSVSSLVLYLIGVHHIDPIKYNLNYKEFLR